MMSGSLAAGACCSWLPAFADEVAATAKTAQRHCVLLWMTGGPSQLDTFDMKPGHANGGQFKPIDTSVPGLQISEHLPKLATLAEHLAIVRGVSTKEGDHGRGTYLLRTGHMPGGPIQYPTFGSSLSKELGGDDAELPNYVSIAPYRIFNRAAFQPGFLGPKHAPLTVAAADNFNVAMPNANAANGGYSELKVDDLQPGTALAGDRETRRLQMHRLLQDGFRATHFDPAVAAHDTAFSRAVALMHSDGAKAFDVSQEPATVRDAYGKTRFGQGCLMARRLIERGVPLVEVSLGTFGNGALAWDTHANNFNAVKNLSGELDAGWGTLIKELADRGLLERTTFLWMGEFGRTPKINQAGGRDHYPNAWSCVLGGGGIKGGQAFGKTSADGTTVEEGKVDVGNILVTLARALGVDPQKQNVSEVGRPIRLAEGDPIRAVLT